MFAGDCMNYNICKFFPSADTRDINILNFVYETEKQCCDGLKYETVYKMHIVVGGSGKMHTGGGVFELEEGDVFFTFPSMLYALESGENFEYMYISYIGLRTNELTEKLNITKNNFIFKNTDGLIPIWKRSILDDNLILSLRCEGILLYTFSALGTGVVEGERQNGDIVLTVKKYIEDNFTDSRLTPESISREFSYNKKYLSAVFKQKLHIGMSQYITLLRIQYACTLMENGFTSVKNIALQCGFSEPLYFSKVFKSKMGLSPKEHMTAIKNKQ